MLSIFQPYYNSVQLSFLFTLVPPAHSIKSIEFINLFQFLCAPQGVRG